MYIFFFFFFLEGGGVKEPGCYGSNPNFMKNFFFPKSIMLCCVMLINIYNRTDVQKCTVFKINKKYSTPYKILHDHFHAIGDLFLQQIFRTLVNLNCFSTICFYRFLFIIIKGKRRHYTVIRIKYQLVGFL